MLQNPDAQTLDAIGLLFLVCSHGVDATLEEPDGAVDIDVALTPEAQARWLLAQLLSWHRREEMTAEVIDGPASVVNLL